MRRYVSTQHVAISVGKSLSDQFDTKPFFYNCDRANVLRLNVLSFLMIYYIMRYIL